MYTHFFNLKQSPFSIAPDPRYLFMSERHREALAHLLYGVGSGGGFVLLTGEIGAGKTTVCRCFMEQIPENCKLAYIFNPKLSVEELLLSICDEFGIAPAPAAAGGAASVKSYVDAINGYLLESYARSQNNVLIIDEAQNLSAEVLEQLRLLTNLETSERKLLQIILIGQPELRAMLARPELEQLAQRVIARYHLGSLSPAETGAYIGHRLAVAGATAMAPFPPRLIAMVHQLTKGVPRRINLLCDRALLGAYVENAPVVTRTILRRAAAEVFVEQGAVTPALKRQWPYALLGLLAGVAITGAVAWQRMPHSVVATAGTPGGQPALPSAAARGPVSPGMAAAALASAAAAMAGVAHVPAGASMQASLQAAPPAATQARTSATTQAAMPLPTQAATAATTQAATPAAALPVGSASPAVAYGVAAPASATRSDAALRQLAALWGQSLPDGDSCAAAAKLNLRCLQGKGDLDDLRRVDRARRRRRDAGDRRQAPERQPRRAGRALRRRIHHLLARAAQLARRGGRRRPRAGRGLAGQAPGANLRPEKAGREPGARRAVATAFARVPAQPKTQGRRRRRPENVYPTQSAGRRAGTAPAARRQGTRRHGGEIICPTYWKP